MQNVKISTSDNIRTIMISRPEQRNAFTDPLAEELCQAFEEANRDDQVTVVLLTGDPAGGAFCAGADLGGNGAQFKQDNTTEKPASSSRAMSVSKHRDSGGTVGLAILNSTKPVICALNGAAVGVSHLFFGFVLFHLFIRL
jgi:enoyl-CoA hydratase/carnithine racemase